MYVDRSRGWVGGTTKGRLDGDFSVRGTVGKKEEEGRTRPQRGRGPLGTIGSPAIRGINMLDTSPPRGNAFVTPLAISRCPSLHIYISLSLILSIPRLVSLHFVSPTPLPSSILVAL